MQGCGVSVGLRRRKPAYMNALHIVPSLSKLTPIMSNQVVSRCQVTTRAILNKTTVKIRNKHFPT